MHVGQAKCDRRIVNVLRMSVMSDGMLRGAPQAQLEFTAKVCMTGQVR